MSFSATWPSSVVESYPSVILQSSHIESFHVNYLSWNIFFFAFYLFYGHNLTFLRVLQEVASSQYAIFFPFSLMDGADFIDMCIYEYIYIVNILKVYFTLGSEKKLISCLVSWISRNFHSFPGPKFLLIFLSLTRFFSSQAGRRGKFTLLPDSQKSFVTYVCVCVFMCKHACGTLCIKHFVMY